MTCRWVGVDCGYSQMSIAVLDAAGRVLAVARTKEPRGDGHQRELARARLHILLSRIEGMRQGPVHLAGYCYEHTGVYEAFRQAGWSVVGMKALNDVVGVYGLTAMGGHVLLAGCGSWGQVVYVDPANAIHWPGDDVANEMPAWLLSGRAYAEFLVNSPLDWLRREARAKLGGDKLAQSAHRWVDLGPLLSSALMHPEVRRFLARAADAVLKTRDVLWQHTRVAAAPLVVMGGGAIRDDQLWTLLASELTSRGVSAIRVVGDSAVGLARFAKQNPEADPWAVIGRKKPSWLS